MILTAFTHPETDLHALPGHPERPERVAAAVAGVEAAGVEVEWRLPAEAPRPALERVHPPAHLDALAEACATGTAIDLDTYVGPASWRAALLAAGAALAAVDAAVGGSPSLSLMRPPGHHAEPTRPMGFCLLSNAAIAARHAQAAHGAERVAIVDWDVHHGNGSQAVFWSAPDVLTVSLHQWPLWPMSGLEDERGAGPGLGFTRNLCFAPGTEPAAYLHRFEGEALAAVERFAPDVVLVSCGFDAHRDDPLADLALDAATFGRLAAGARDLCARLGVPPPALLLEGGYSLDAVHASAGAVAAALAAAPDDAQLAT